MCIQTDSFDSARTPVSVFQHFGDPQSELERYTAAPIANPRASIQLFGQSDRYLEIDLLYLQSIIPPRTSGPGGPRKESSPFRIAGFQSACPPNTPDQKTPSDQEVWSAIRYLDLGIDEKQSTRNAILALVAALLIVCVVVWLLRARGL